MITDGTPIRYREITAATEGTHLTLDYLIYPLHAVVFPRLGSRNISTLFGKHCFFGFHSEPNRSVHLNLITIAARDVPAVGDIGPEKGEVNEEI